MQIIDICQFTKPGDVFCTSISNTNSTSIGKCFLIRPGRAIYLKYCFYFAICYFVTCFIKFRHLNVTLLSSQVVYFCFREPCHARCQGLILLETFTTLPSSEINSNLPPFLHIIKEVTGDPAFSMYNLALK